MWMTHTISEKIISFLFPKSCYVCKKENSSFCKECLSSCKKTIETPFLYSFALYSFKDIHIKKAIHAIKYFHRKDLILPFGETLSILLLDLEKEGKINKDCILIPIPMPKLRKYIRGYNQAEELAKIISKKTFYPISTNILHRKSSPKRQVLTTARQERLKNQKGSFYVEGNIVNKNIILVDDVITTGGTIQEARNFLIKAGAKNVYSITIAH